MSAQSDVYLEDRGSVFFICVSSATNPAPGIEDMPHNTCWIRLSLRKRIFDILCFHPSQFLKNVLMLNFSLALEVGHAVRFIYWSLYLLNSPNICWSWTKCQVLPDTDSIAVGQCSPLSALLELRVWWGKEDHRQESPHWIWAGQFSENSILEIEKLTLISLCVWWQNLFSYLKYQWWKSDFDNYSELS